MILMIPRCRLLGHSHNNCHRDPFSNEIEWIFIVGSEVYNILFLRKTIVDILINWIGN